MAQDPIFQVASWIAPAAANLSTTSADVDRSPRRADRGTRRLYRLAEDTRARGDKIKSALPDDVRFEKVPVSFLGLAGDEGFQLNEIVASPLEPTS